jgi:hypothetical protein
MHIFRRWATAFVLVAALCVPHELAFSSPPSMHQSHRVILRGSDSGWARLRLSRPVRVTGTVTISGAGRIIGFVLVPDPLPRTWTSGPFLYGASFGRCATSACKPSLARGGFQFGSSRLPAGKYRIYLIADAASAHVEIPLKGLKHNLRVDVDHKARVDIRSLTPRLDQVPGRALYSAGSKSQIGGKGLALQGMWLDSSASVVGTWGNCIYKRGQTMPDPKIAYLPANLEACRAPDPEDSLATVGQVEGLRVTTSSAYSYLPKALGAWYSSASLIRGAGAVAAWLRF